MTRSRQRGAAAVFAGISVILGLICIALAWDLGRMYFIQRDLQRIANVAALDAARAAGGCITAVTNPDLVAVSEGTESAVRNGASASWVTVTVGRKLGAYAVRYFDPARDDKNRAVRVTVTRPMPARLLPLYGLGDGPTTLTATAAAYATPSATVKMGTMVASFHPPNASALNSLFTGLLGASPGLDLLSYQALFSAQVTIAGLTERLALGPTNDLDTPVTQRALLNALAQQLSAQGDGAAAGAASTLAGVAPGGTTIIPSQILGTNNPASSATLSAGDIAMAAGQAASTGSLVNFPINLPAPLNGLLTLSLVQPALPTLLIPGGIELFPENFASNTQALAQAAIPLNLPLGLLGLNAAANLNLFVQAGKGTAEIDHLSCARRGQPVDLAYVRAQTSILNVGIGKFNNINAPNPTPDYADVINVTLTILGVPIKLRASALAYIPLASANDVLETPFTAGQTQHMGTPRVGAITGNIHASNVDVRIDEISIAGAVPPLVKAALNSTLALLGPAVQLAVKNAVVAQLAKLADASVLPLLDNLGVTVGGADVTVTSIEAPQPYLFTH